MPIPDLPPPSALASAPAQAASGSGEPLRPSSEMRGRLRSNKPHPPWPSRCQTSSACGADALDMNLSRHGTVHGERVPVDGREGAANAADLLAHGERQRARQGMAARIGCLRESINRKGSDAGAMRVAGGHASVSPVGERSVGDPDRSAHEADRVRAALPPRSGSGPSAPVPEGVGTMSKEHMGSSLDDFLKQEGDFDEAQAQAIKEVVAWAACRGP